MAVPYNLVTMSGTIAGQEIWSTSCAFISAGGTGPVESYDDLLAWANGCRALVANDYSQLVDELSTAGILNLFRVAYVDITGKTAQVAEAAPATPWTGTIAPTMPPQCSVVISLMTGRPGRSYRGRMYWPMLRAQLQAATCELLSGTSGNTALAAAALLTDIGGAAGSTALMLPAVYSSVLGQANLVTSVRVGTVVDTQRRRRNSLQEDYTASPVPPAA